MSTLNKVLNYLQSHKKSVTSKNLADYFLVSVSTVNRALSMLEKQGHAKRIRTQTSHYWIYCRPAVAIPDTADQRKHKSPAYSKPRPIQNSYPSIRGYDD